MAEYRKDDAYQITWLVRRLFRAMGQAANAYIEDLGVTAAERAVMEFLVRNTRMTVPEMARAYDVSRQHIQTSVNLLLEKKLAVLEENPGHKRSPYVALSNKGSRLFAKIANRDEALIETVFAKVGKSDQKTTRQTLETMLKNLSIGAPS
jgi:DNA-binding MarR family transcriptional regulator